MLLQISSRNNISSCNSSFFFNLSPKCISKLYHQISSFLKIHMAKASLIKCSLYFSYCSHEHHRIHSIVRITPPKTGTQGPSVHTYCWMPMCYAVPSLMFSCIIGTTLNYIFLLFKTLLETIHSTHLR